MYICIMYLVLWQRGLVEREINELLRELTLDDGERKRLNYNYKIKVFSLFLFSSDACFSQRIDLINFLILKPTRQNYSILKKFF